MNNFTVPKPCHENWENMLPEDKGRFCTACKTKVYDFTKSSNEEIQKIYDQENGNICGKFENSQVLHFTKFQNTVLRIERFTQNHFSKFGILISAVSLLMSISGCDKNKNVEAVGIINDADSTNYKIDSTENNFVIGEPVAPREDSAQIVDPHKEDHEHQIESNTASPPRTIGKPEKIPLRPKVIEFPQPKPLMGVPIYVKDTIEPKIRVREGFPLGKIAPSASPKTEEKQLPKDLEVREIQEVRVVGMVKSRKD